MGGFETYIVASPTGDASDSEEAAICRSGPKDAAKNGTDDTEKLDENSAGAEGDGIRADDDGDTLLALNPGFNSLSIVMRDEGSLRFVKYVERQNQ